MSRKDAQNPSALYNRELRVCDSDRMKLWRKATRLKISANATCCSWTECRISANTSFRPAPIETSKELDTTHGVLREAGRADLTGSKDHPSKAKHIPITIQLIQTNLYYCHIYNY